MCRRPGSSRWSAACCVAAAAAWPCLAAASDAAPLCPEAGFWGTASCLAVHTGALCRDLAGFALAEAVPPSWSSAAERLRWRGAAKQAFQDHDGGRLWSTWTSELLERLRSRAVDALEGMERPMLAIEHWRASFTTAFPEHAGLLRDAPAVLAAGAWVLVTAVLAAYCLGSQCRRRALPEVYFFPDKTGKNVAKICAHIAASRRRVWVAMFTLTDDTLSRAILSAHARGLDVRLIVDDDQCEVLGADAKVLADAGVPVVMDRSSARMHHKFAVLDHAVLSGSFNWTKMASHANSENLCVLRDSSTVKAFADEFLRMWAEFSGRGGRMKAKHPNRRRCQTPPVLAK